MLRSHSLLITALAAGALAAPAAASAAPALQIGSDARADGAYTNLDLANPGDATVSGSLKLTWHGRVVAQRHIEVEGHDETSLPMLKHTRWGAKTLTAHNGLRTLATARLRIDGGGSATVRRTVAVRWHGARGFDGRYKATNGLRFTVRDGFVSGLDQQTMAFCARSSTNEVAFLSDPYDRIDPYVHANGTFAVTGHTGIGQLVTFKGKLKRDGHASGYASYSLSRFGVGSDGSYESDYCATGGRWTAKRVRR